MILNDGSERKVVKEFSESLPDISITIFTEAFIIETVPNKNKLNIVSQFQLRGSQTCILKIILNFTISEKCARLYITDSLLTLG